MNQHDDKAPAFAHDASTLDTPSNGGVVRIGVTVSGVGGFLPAPEDPPAEALDASELPETD